MSALVLSSLQMDRLAGTQLLLVVNVLLVLVIIAFSAGIALAVVRRSMRHRVEAERLAAMGTATARILHQVKNPLQTIVLHVEMLQDDRLSSDPARRRDVVETLIGEATRMAELLEELSAYASGVKRRLRPEPVALARVVAAAAACEMREGEQAGVDVQVGTLDAVRVDGDPYFLRQAIENVLRNGLEASSDVEGGRQPWVRIALRRRKGEAVVEVCDNGPGIPSDQVAQVFEPFVTAKAQGMGLGLPIARDIVEAHEGRIEIRSRAGEGTTVVLVLPVCTDGTGAAVTPSHADEQMAASSPGAAEHGGFSV